MPSLTDLHRAVETVLGTQRIGQPVFVRYLLLSGAPSEHMVSRLAAMAASIGSWLGCSIQRATVLGAPDQGAPSLILHFPTGACAIASLATGEPSADLTVLGNHGAIYHQAALDTLDELPSSDSELEHLIERALTAQEGAP
jgi:hypothetical protein